MEEFQGARESIIRRAEGILEDGILPIVPPSLSVSVTIDGDDGDNELIGDDFTANGIIGGDGNDTIFGGLGTIVIIGGGGNNTIFGSGSEFGIEGGDGDDTIFGGLGNIVIRGADGNDAIFGGDNIDILVGDPGNDRLEGNGGDDDLSGGAGNDLIIGGSGNDIVAGVNLEGGDSEPGEIDTLVGGAGSDLFWLGNTEDYLYDDGVKSGFPSFGTGDYALITDFSVGEDLIQLNGSANQYVTVATGAINPQVPSGTGIFRNEGGFLSSDLVGVVEGIDPSQLSLTDTSQFTYV